MSDLVLYNGAYTGPQVDQAISRALTGGELDKEIEALKAAVGSPLLANTAADMTNINKIYVYVGSEPGYTNGDWYYWDGAAWVSGGQYLSPGYTFDDAPTEGSDNPVKSGGIFAAIEAALDEAMTTALAAYPTDTASGSIASFPDGADNIPVKSMTVQIEPQQSGSGDPAPDNVRPITGWTEANIYETGINIMDEQFEIGTISVVDGQNIADNSVMRTINYIPVKPNTTYYYRAPALAAVHYYDENKTWLGYSAISENSPFTTPENAFFVRLRLGAAYGTTYNHDVAILYPSTNTSYAPYNADSTTYAVDWTDEGTVYGGTAEYIGGGQWRVTPRMASVDLGDLSWYAASQNRFYAAVPGAVNDATNRTDVLCSIYNPAAVVAQGNMWLNQGNIYIVDANYSTSAAFAEAVDGIDLIYPLATPVSFIVDGPDPATLLGNNNVWADCGPLTLNYRADTGLYIDKKLGA